MKYRNSSDNYYDTEVFKSRGKTEHSNVPIKNVITPKIIEQAVSFLEIYRMLKKARFILLILVVLSPYLLILPFAAIFMCYYMQNYNSVKLKYKISKEQQEAFLQSMPVLKKIMKSKKISWAKSKSQVIESRYEAGAGEVWDTVRCWISKNMPFPFEGNIKVWSVKSKNESVTFFPDKILIIDGDNISAIPNSDVEYEYEDFDFIESEDVPQDTEVVYYTWAYVNNDGSPDRRFKYNRQLPICEYGKVRISSKDGLNLILIFSNRRAWYE